MFDVDKLYVMMPEFEKNYDKEDIKNINKTIRSEMRKAVKSKKTGFSQMVPDESFDIARILSYIEDGVRLDFNDNIVYELYKQGLATGLWERPNFRGIRKIEFDYTDIFKETKTSKTVVNEDINFIFNKNPELYNIGSQKDYSEYIKTIFPDSKVKNIVYHHSSKKIEEFDKSYLGKETGAADTQLGFFFSETKEVIPEMVKEKNKKLEEIGSDKRLDFSVQNNVLINIKKPRYYEGFIDNAISDLIGRHTSVIAKTAIKDFKEAREKLEKEYDSLVYGLSYDVNEEGFDEIEKGYVVLEPSQAHVLGSNKDIKGFKKYVETINSKRSLDVNKIKNQSKAARNNAKLDIVRSILTNSDTFEKFIKPGGFDTLSNLAKKVLGLEGKSGESLPLILPSTYAEIFSRNMTGKQLVGIFANHNAHHAVLQHTDVAFAEEFVLGEVSKSSLNDVKDENGNYISRNVAEFLAAVVDNAKDPLSSFINVNTYTADVAATLTRLGYPLETVVNFMSQPVLKRFSELYFNNGANFQAESYARKQILNKFTNIGVKFTSKNPKDDNAQLEKNIKSGDVFTQEQFDIFQKFLDFKERSKALADLVRATRADTKGAGPTLSENEQLIKLNKKIRDSKILINFEPLLNGEVYPMINSFYENGIVKPNELLSEYFPWMTEEFSFIKDAININIKGRDLSVSEIELLNYEILSYFSSGFEFFNGSDRSEIINNLPKQLQEFKDNNKELVEDNLFLKKMLVRKNPTGLDRIEFKNPGKLTNEERDAIQQDWKILFNSDEYNELASKLVKYNFYSNAFQLNPNSFGHLIPTEFYSKLTNSNGVSFSDYLYSIKEGANNSLSEETLVIASNFIDQFYRNNSHRSNFVPPINKDKTNITSAINYEKNIPVSFVVNSSDSDTVNDFVLEIDDAGARFSPFVKLVEKGQTYLFAPEISPENPYVAIYRLVEKLGSPNEAIEYDRSSFALKSVIKSNELITTKQNDYIDITEYFDNDLDITDSDIQEQIKFCKK